MQVLKSTKTKLGNAIDLISTSPSTLQLFNPSTTLVIGVFHGDEPQGKYLIEKYLESNFSPSKSKISRRGVLFIPCLNPDGMQLGTRTNANGVDLNRNFPTKNWGEDTSEAGLFNFSPSPQPSPQGGEEKSPYFGGKSAGSEIETKFVMEVIEEYKPEKILTLHAPYKVVNYDGPAREWAEQISKIINYPVEESIGYPTPGSFGTYCGVERNIPTITLELDEKIPVEQLEQPVFDIFDEL